MSSLLNLSVFNFGLSKRLEKNCKAYVGDIGSSYFRYIVSVYHL